MSQLTGNEEVSSTDRKPDIHAGCEFICVKQFFVHHHEAGLVYDFTL